ncbi:MAG: hypothetical protein AB9846_08195 [Tenuifilaceae bacterium]
MKRISLTENEVKDLLDLYQSEIDRAQRRINNLKNIIIKLSEEQIAEEPITVKPLVKGKRGRKPKVKVLEAPLRKDTLEVKEKKAAKVKKITSKKEEIKAEEIQEPKKRGRKKKVIEVKVAPKKRGRKKKVATVKPTPKKRGRKPKSLRKPIKGGKGKDKVKWNDFIIETITSKNSLLLASSLTQAALEKFQIPNSDRDRVRMAISTTLTKMVKDDKVLITYTQTGIRGSFYGLTQWFNDKAQLKPEYKSKLM